MTPKRGRKIHLLYVDDRLDPAEVQKVVNLVWQEIQLVEYDLIYEGFRGVHLSEDETEIYVTFQLASGGLDNAAMVIFNRETEVIDFAPPPSELLEKEIANLERILGADSDDIEAQELAARLRSVEDLLY